MVTHVGQSILTQSLSVSPPSPLRCAASHEWADAANISYTACSISTLYFSKQKKRHASLHAHTNLHAYKTYINITGRKDQKDICRRGQRSYGTFSVVGRIGTYTVFLCVHLLVSLHDGALQCRHVKWHNMCLYPWGLIIKWLMKGKNLISH